MTETSGSADSLRAPTSPLMVMILNTRALEAKLEKQLKEMGLSLRRLGLLGHVRAEPGISFSSLARRAGIRVQSLQPIIEGMLSDGLVQAVGGVGQGRAAVLELTSRGQDALKEAYEVIAALDRETFADGEWKELGAALTHLGEAWLVKR
ncbi:MarR family transcriptional regulator [Streptomyces sp. AK02-01A]|uniref:MarR family winged helix-turn-helix transcriptional regulator n=1 Tax=Streptomyces sp. AK02-01A TaxID=3028648 RepID=UPI0029AD839D|nr:MarR family transcriptional regulator [Streptomyces sp. AK02-01A]MDX3854002.1 MarR family transcriptional regulator [Streptomyces sp. AK02-01A]